MITLDLASRDDDAGIRRLLSSMAMPGRIRVRFEREPSYFDGCAPNAQVLVAREGARIVGVACREIRKLYVNGVPEDVGYLGQLRVDPAYRGRMLVARGYAMMRELHADGRARGYLTTIVDGNDVAEGVLVKRARGAMPRYRFLEKLYTLALGVRRLRRRRPSGGTPIEPIPNFFPAYEPHGEIVRVEGGEAALIDQRAYKQTIIDGYDTATRVARPIYNLFADIELPKRGATLNHAYVTHFRATDPHALIEALRAKAREKNFDHILLGFTESDPALQIARTFKPVEYVSSIYTVSWDDDLHDRLDSRPRALDISAL